MNELKQGAYWTDPTNQIVWGWVERYHVGIGGWGEHMRVRVEDRKEAWEFVPERTCTLEEVEGRDGVLYRCTECGCSWSHDQVYFCPNCGAKVVDE